MKIGFDGSRAFISKRTGTENYSYQLLKALSRIDQKNDYKIFLRPGVKIQERWPDNFQFININWSRLWTQGGLSLQTFKENLDVLFVPAHTLPLIKRPGLKTVVTVHDLGSEYLPNTHQVKQKLYLSLMQRHQLKSVTKLIAVSKATKQDLIEKIGISADKIKVIYEGYDQKLFVQIKNEVLHSRLKYFDIVKGQYFLFVGTIQPRKNLVRLIEAFSKIVQRDLKLVIAGKKGWKSDDIYKLPKKLGIEDRVKFFPAEGQEAAYVENEDLPVLYSGAIALVFPSLFEGFGLPIVEAQACGCPVITSNTSSMPEIAGSEAMLIDPYDVDDIVRGMQKIQEPKIQAKSIKGGFTNIKRFSWDKCAQETLDLLEGIG